VKAIREYFTSKRQLNYLRISALIFVAAMLLTSYLNRHLGILSFKWGVIIVVISLIPALIITTINYILADGPERKQYRIRLYLGVIVFSIIGYLRYGI